MFHLPLLTCLNFMDFGPHYRFAFRTVYTKFSLRKAKQRLFFAKAKTPETGSSF